MNREKLMKRILRRWNYRKVNKKTTTGNNTIVATALMSPDVMKFSTAADFSVARSHVQRLIP